MEKIIVGFSRPKKWMPYAWLIMKGFGINYSHVYLKFHSNSYDRDIIYQASKSMINFMSTKVFGDEEIIVKEFEVEISEKSRISLMQFAIDNAGKPYSLREAIGLGLVRICALFGKKITNPFKDGTDSYVCSVLADYILENFAEQDIPGDFQDSDPKYLYNYLTAAKAKQLDTKV